MNSSEMDDISPEEIAQFQQFLAQFRAPQCTNPPPMSTTSSSTAATQVETSTAQLATTSQHGPLLPAPSQLPPSYRAIPYSTSNTTQQPGPPNQQPALHPPDSVHNLHSQVPPINPYQSLQHTSASGPPLMGDSFEALVSVPLYGGGLPANVPNLPHSMGHNPPFLGFQQLTGHVNQTRLAAASANIPHRPSLQAHWAASGPSQTQTHRNWGQASHPPSAHWDGLPQVEDCLFSATSQGEPTHMHLLVKVLPSHKVCSNLGCTFTNYWVWLITRGILKDTLYIGFTLIPSMPCLSPMGYSSS